MLVSFEEHLLGELAEDTSTLWLEAATTPYSKRKIISAFLLDMMALSGVMSI
jgi:hypothetical protein